MKFAFLLIGLFTANAIAQTCPSNDSLRAKGFVIHPSSEFQTLASEKIAMLKRQASDFEFDTEGRWRDVELRRSLLAQSWDRVSTPQEIMYGDLLVIEDLDNGLPLEVRWYDGQKHVVYDDKVQACANSALDPWAENALF